MKIREMIILEVGVVTSSMASNRMANSSKWAGILLTNSLIVSPITTGETI